MDLMTLLRSMQGVQPAPQGAYTGPEAPPPTMGIAPLAPVQTQGAGPPTAAAPPIAPRSYPVPPGDPALHPPTPPTPPYYPFHRPGEKDNSPGGGGGLGGMAGPAASLGPNPETGAVINGGMITSPFAALYDQAQINQYALRNPQLVPSIALGRGGGGDFGGGGAGNVRVGTLDWWNPNARVKYGKGEPK